MSLGDQDLNTPTNEAMMPSLQLSDSRGTRYPNQFFDLSQQYMPPTIKELFRWCTFYYYNSPLIGATMKKVSRYPITDLIFEDEKESVRNLWERIMMRDLRLKERLIEINLDFHVYGNAFISIHLPFTRFLTCRKCGNSQPIKNWDWYYTGNDYTFAGTCSACNVKSPVDVKDVPYKDINKIKIIRWNPENMHIKFNEYTGRYIYMYTVPPKLRNMIVRGDKDILEDTPLVVLEALKKRRMIRLNPDNLCHLKAPTLAEQDQGWGKPAIIHVLKDMYYLYTLRRAQEAIAMEHILPLDIIYPLPNGQQDPFIHVDLANWRVQIESIIRKHRRDPNYKGVMPIPVNTARVGGDGKMLMLSPELSYLNQTIVGGLGMSSEMLFGQGTTYTGSSIQLRMMENDFIQNRCQLNHFILWLKDRIRSFVTLPNIDNIRFTDFRMADDVQRNQQMIGLNAQGKLSDDTLLTELGYDYEQEQQKLLAEAQFKNHIVDIQTKGNAKSQGEAQVIQMNYQKKMNALAGGQPTDGQAMAGGEMAGQDPSGQAMAGGETAAPDEYQSKIDSWATKLMSVDPQTVSTTLAELKAKMPAIGNAIEQKMNALKSGSQGMGGQGGNSMNTEVNMSPMPEKSAPRRPGAV